MVGRSSELMLIIYNLTFQIIHIIDVNKSKRENNQELSNNVT